MWCDDDEVNRTRGGGREREEKMNEKNIKIVMYLKRNVIISGA